MEQVASRATLGVLIRTVFLLLGLAVVGPSNAEPGIDWLVSQAQPDGGIATGEDTSTAFQATSEAIRALKAHDRLDWAGVRNASQFLLADGRPGIEHRVRKIILLVETNGDPSALVEALAATQSSTGGFGNAAGYNPTVLDTAMALEALAVSNYSDTEALLQAAIWLADVQAMDGGWGVEPGKPASVYATARVLSALWPLRKRLQVDSLIAEARDYLLTRRGVDGAWGNILDTGAALTALYPTTRDKAPLKPAKDQLRSWQSGDGSWGQDVFLTALALRALASAERPFSDYGAITGVAVDGEHGTPIVGATVSVSGTSGAETLTDAKGRFLLSALEAGDYHLTFSAPGYAPVEGNTHVRPGDEKDVGTIRMLASGGTDTVAVSGTVTDAATGSPLSGVGITVDGADTAAAETDATGEFYITGLTPGELIISAAREGYYSTEGRITVEAGINVLFSTTLRPVPKASFELFGTITAKACGGVLAGATVTVSGAAEVRAVTDDSGRYHFTDLPVGEVAVEITAPEYEALVTTLTPKAGQRVEYSPKIDVEQPTTADLRGQVVDQTTWTSLAGVQVSVSSGISNLKATTDETGQFLASEIPAGVSEVSFELEGYKTLAVALPLTAGVDLEIAEVPLVPNDAAYLPTDEPVPATASARVVDSTTGEPLSGINVTVNYNGEITTLQTGGDGRFSFKGYLKTAGVIGLGPSGYVPVEHPVYLLSDPTDIGQIRLRPKSVSTLNPDLRAGKIDVSEMITDPTTLEVTGVLGIDIKNIGLAPASGYHVIAFYDADKNYKYSSPDTVLGESSHEGNLEASEEIHMEFAIDGTLPFRDAPIAVWVDSEEEVVESAERNNYAYSTSSCLVEPSPGTAKPVLKWHWSGSDRAPDYNQVMSAPVVGQLTDDNSDGVIDSADTPDVVFATFRGKFYRNSVGVLRAISGEDGKEIWDAALPIQVSSIMQAPALGDVDKDGLVEIVVGGPDEEGLRVYDNNGALKWSIETSEEAQPALADLDADGNVEIVYGHEVYDSSGTLKWRVDHLFPYRHRLIDLGDTPTVLDLDLDGLLEVVIGGAAYDAYGNMLWNSGYKKADWGAVADFDNDRFPEIALALYKRNSIIVLEHDGSKKWGPVSVPGGGGGPLTVADVDGDGSPEIGVAGLSYYCVFEPDGSLKWKNRISDRSSGYTGSSVFDFDGDGLVEVLYADELNLYIYEGATGNVMYEIPNSSGTLGEYPVVADVDVDGQAEIVVGSNNYYRDGVAGIRAFESSKDDWMPTRKIWNQHSYHVTNINDDGSIPKVERNSWLEHNTYRLNRFMDRDPRGSADLTVSRLQVSDNGAGKPSDITIRIGNGGGLDTDRSTTVALYDGDPSKGAVILSSLEVPPMVSGAYMDLTFPDVEYPESGQFLAWADSSEQISECNEHNNRQPVAATSARHLGDISVDTDSTEYGAHTLVTVHATGTNRGSFAGSFDATLSIEDEGGNSVAELGRFELGELASGAKATVEATWETRATIAGDYRVRAQLLTADDKPVDSDLIDFRIVHGTGGNPVAELRIRSDRLAYHTTDEVVLDSLVRNLTVNTILEAGNVAVAVTAPDGTLRWEDTLPLATIGPGGEHQLFDTVLLEDVPQGKYQVSATLMNNGGVVLAHDETDFRVVYDATKALTGSIDLETPSLYQGQTQTCTGTLNNEGSLPLEGLPVRQVIISVDGKDSILEELSEVVLPARSENDLSYVFSTTPVPVGTASCILQAALDGNWVTLDYATFEVTEPPIRIDARLESGARGRLLVLLDNGGTATGRRGDPHGPREKASLAEQRPYLEALLTEAGWSYTIVTDADAFVRELRSGGYQVYLLQSEQVKLPETAQKELREAVYRGQGLVVAGDHDERNHDVHDALGTRLKGKVNHAEGLELSDNTLTAAGQVFFGDPRQALRFRSVDNEVVGRLLTKGQPAVTRYAYGEGRSVLIGIDLLAEAAQREDSEALLGRLLLGALEDVHPEELEPIEATPYPIHIKLANEGITTPGQVVFPVPDGTGVVEAPGALVADGQVTWTFDLAEAGQETFPIWLELPGVPGPIEVAAVVQTGTEPDLEEYERIAYTVDVVPGGSLDVALSRCEALRRDKTVKKVCRDLDAAKAAYNRQDLDRAVFKLTKATDRLQGEIGDDLVNLRLEIARAIAFIGMEMEG